MNNYFEEKSSLLHVFLEKQYPRPFRMGTNLRYKFLRPDLNICEIVEQILIETGANMLNNHPPPPLNLKSCFTWRQKGKRKVFQKYFPAGAV